MFCFTFHEDYFGRGNSSTKTYKTCGFITNITDLMPRHPIYFYIGDFFLAYIIITFLFTKRDKNK